jgi:hypothetical protein
MIRSTASAAELVLSTLRSRFGVLSSQVLLTVVLVLLLVAAVLDS